MVLEGLGGGVVVILDCSMYLASFLKIWGVAGCLCLILERI